MVSFFATHAWEGVNPPYQPMNESMNLYINQTIPKPRTAMDQHWKLLPWFFMERNMLLGESLKLLPFSSLAASRAPSVLTHLHG